MTLVKSAKSTRLATDLFSQHVHSPSFASLTNHFRQADKLKDYCIPVNSYFPTPAVMEALYERLPYALKYYPSANAQIAEMVCAFADVADPRTVIVGNGSTELISWLNSLFIRDNVLVPVPSFGRWTDEPKGLGRDVKLVHYTDELDQCLSAEVFVAAVRESGAHNAVICNPNNPTGSIWQRDELIWIMNELRHLDTLVIDESFIDFSQAEPPTVKDVVADFDNAWVLKSLGKNVGLHGLRMGYAISNPRNIAALRKHLPFWNVNGVTELLLSLIIDAKADYERSRLRVIDDRDYAKRQFEALSAFRVFPSAANFIYAKLADALDGDQLREQLLLHQQCFVRNCGNKVGGSSQYFRIAARPPADVDFLVRAMRVEIEHLRSAAFLAEMSQAGYPVVRMR